MAKADTITAPLYIDYIADSYSYYLGEEVTFYIDGTVDGKIREEIRKAIESEDNAILVASLGTTSTGISINKLHHMIAASPSKSKIKVLQSIGRILRLHETKDRAVLYDIVDDLSYKTSRNFTLNHFAERAKIYDEEKFDYKIGRWPQAKWVYYTSLAENFANFQTELVEYVKKHKKPK